MSLDSSPEFFGRNISVFAMCFSKDWVLVNKNRPGVKEPDQRFRGDELMAALRLGLKNHKVIPKK